jgi:hypothetical protein
LAIYRYWPLRAKRGAGFLMNQRLDPIENYTQAC